MQHHHDHCHSHGGHDHALHHHGHGGHSHVAPSSHPAFFFAILLNLAFTILQVFYAYQAHSTSLLADAGHNFSDVLALAFSWLALFLTQKKANQLYSYGYKKSTILATLMNAILLVIACTLILVETVDHLFFSHPSVMPIPVMVVAFIGILINGGSALFFLKKSKEDLNIKSAYLHLLYDALISFSVLLTGVVLYFTHWNLLDPIIGLVITLFILKNSLGLLKHTIELSLDGVPRNIDYQAVLNYLLKIEGVIAVHELHIWAMSTTENALTVHLIRPQGNLDTVMRQKLSHDLAHDFKITHTTVQIEEHAIEECLHEQSCK
jgi:cobalt-zinc-cadmium efflux system protein